MQKFILQLIFYTILHIFTNVYSIVNNYIFFYIIYTNNEIQLLHLTLSDINFATLLLLCYTQRYHDLL